MSDELKVGDVVKLVSYGGVSEIVNEQLRVLAASEVRDCSTYLWTIHAIGGPYPTAAAASKVNDVMIVWAPPGLLGCGKTTPRIMFVRKEHVSFYKRPAAKADQTLITRMDDLSARVKDIEEATDGLTKDAVVWDFNQLRSRIKSLEQQVADPPTEDLAERVADLEESTDKRLDNGTKSFTKHSEAISRLEKQLKGLKDLVIDCDLTARRLQSDRIDQNAKQISDLAKQVEGMQNSVNHAHRHINKMQGGLQTASEGGG